MRLYFVILLVAFTTVCFSTPRKTRVADKTDSTHGKNVSKIFLQGYFNVERTSKILSENISNIRNPDSSQAFSLQVSSRQDGLTGDLCNVPSDCQGSRICQNTDFGRRCFFGELEGSPCKRSSDCSSGERCYRDLNGNEFCVSEKGAGEINDIRDIDNLQPALVPVDDGTRPLDDEDCGCIGTYLLIHLSRNKLVYEKDILSNVLCDKQNSCATAGHMVTYHGKGMMMKSYCEIIGGCTKKVMYVNSPRYSMKATVPSLSENMVFTAFSARYETRAEEGMLATAIKLGF